jgi:hypothetical protein
MIDSSLGRAAFRIGFYVTFMAGLLSLVTQAGSAERAISVLTFVIGLIFLVVITILVRFGSRR